MIFRGENDRLTPMQFYRCPCVLFLTVTQIKKIKIFVTFKEIEFN